MSKKLHEYELDQEEKALVGQLEHEARSKGEQATAEQLVKAVETFRVNKAAEAEATTPRESKKLAELLTRIRVFKRMKNDLAVDIDTALHDSDHSSEYNANTISELKETFNSAIPAHKAATVSLLNDIVEGCEAYDKAFYTSGDRFETAERIISVMRSAGNNIEYDDYITLVAPLYGDLAAARYVVAALKDSTPSARLHAVKLMADTPNNLFSKCYTEIDAMYAMKYTPYIETHILEAAKKAGLDAYTIDESRPKYSADRVVPIEASVDTAELVTQAAKIAGVQI